MALEVYEATAQNGWKRVYEIMPVSKSDVILRMFQYDENGKNTITPGGPTTEEHFFSYDGAKGAMENDRKWFTTVEV